MGKELIDRLRAAWKSVDFDLLIIAAWLGVCVASILAAVTVAHAQSAGGLTVPASAMQYLPTLAQKQRAIWPDAPMPSFLGAQVEQETCIRLDHAKCWNPRAELKTSREYGVGFGQFTRAYRSNGSIRFDKIGELRAAHASLHGWTWANRYDPGFQLSAIIEMDRAIYLRTYKAATDLDHLGFTLSAYNGGEGGVLQDRRLCGNTDGCDSTRWSGNVADTSLKARAPSAGYGKSFYAINREYVANIIGLRRPKYEPYFRKKHD